MELVINFSGGKNSTAMLAWLCETYPDVPKHVVMVDTGREKSPLHFTEPLANNSTSNN